MSRCSRQKGLVVNGWFSELLRTGVVYIVPANYHGLIEANNCFSLDVSEPVLFSRPSINVVFTSFAKNHAKNSIAILLSGANADGAAGLALLKSKKAHTIAQMPDDAEVPTIPKAALKFESGHEVLTETEIITFLSNINAHVSDKHSHC